MVSNISRNGSQNIRYCISDKTSGRRDEEVGNIGSEQDSVNSELKREDGYLNVNKAKT
jgi:hypothetical protein